MHQLPIQTMSLCSLKQVISMKKQNIISSTTIQPFGTYQKIDFSSNSYSTFVGTVAYGLDFNKIYNFPMHAELEYANFGKTKTHVDLPKFDGTQHTLDYSIKSQTLMLNGYYDFKNQTALTPYIVAGVGMVHHNLKANSDTWIQKDEHQNNTADKFAWRTDAGLNYKINEK